VIARYAKRANISSEKLDSFTGDSWIIADMKQQKSNEAEVGNAE
jgi:hypothetical protein